MQLIVTASCNLKNNKLMRINYSEHEQQEFQQRLLLQAIGEEQ